MRLIDADKIPYEECYVPDGDTQWGYKKALIAEKAVIDQIPIVDAVPVVHGRWIPTYHTYYNRDGECKIADEWHCSECEIYSKDKWNYCPNCGAHMNLEVE